MKHKLWLSTFLTWFLMCNCQNYKNNPWAKKPTWAELYHYPEGYTYAPSPFVNGTDVTIPPTRDTPDFRLEENAFTVYNKKYFEEEERPYRLSPHYKQQKQWHKKDQANNFGCYCVTVFKKAAVLGSCAVITTRHILTTATSTDTILKHYKKRPQMSGLLGAWYDTNANLFNSSMYMTPARIHYHPMYRYDYEVNASHPIPCMYDLSLWAATYRFQGYYASFSGAIICQRACSSWMAYRHTIPDSADHHMFIGFLFIKAYYRRPMPWFKYGVRTRQYIWPCPKIEWNWFHCIKGDWAKYGMDSGGGMHFMDRGTSWRNDGFVGMCAFSMYLRSRQLVHYYTVVDTYPVLDFLYEAMLGRQPYVYLDSRFYDTQWAAPKVYWGEYVYHDYSYGWQYKDFKPPNYRR